MPRPPSLYQLNTRVLLTERARDLGRPATLDDFTDAFLDGIAARGFGWAWFLGLWQTGEAARRVSLTHAGLREECARALPDLTDADITSSPYAITAYTVHTDFGGDAALARLRRRLAERGLGLIADFVVNHGALDHPWLASHPERFVIGSDQDLAAAPQDWVRLPAGPSGKPTVVAHGKDPYFPGWPDTVQYNLRHPACREALMAELAGLASRCDGLRCDMAMLAQADVFQRTWGDRARPADGAQPADGPFWPEAIRRVKAGRPDFLFIAEVYWDREGALQDEGFDFTYDKRLYDRLHRGAAGPVRDHLRATPAFQAKSLRFLENHDEPRAAAAFPPDRHRAAALATFLIPGLRFFHEGQLDGRQVKVSMHLGRRPSEPARPEWQAFYGRLLEVLKRPEIQQGRWDLCEPQAAWDGNPTADQFLAYTWGRPGSPGLFVVINYGPSRGQCYIRMDLAEFPGDSLKLKDLFSDAGFVRETADVSGHGMYFDMPAWEFHCFEIQGSPSVDKPVRMRAGVASGR